MKCKKMISLFLAGAMSLSLMACGNKETVNEEPADTESAAEETTGEETAEETKGDEKLVVWTLANDLTDFGEKYKEKTGVNVETVVIQPADYPTKVQTALLAGEKGTGYHCGRTTDA